VVRVRDLEPVVALVVVSMFRLVLIFIDAFFTLVKSWNKFLWCSLKWHTLRFKFMYTLLNEKSATKLSNSRETFNIWVQNMIDFAVFITNFIFALWQTDRGCYFCMIWQVKCNFCGKYLMLLIIIVFVHITAFLLVRTCFKIFLKPERMKGFPIFSKSLPWLC
jgi:hypothetical protein